LPAIRQAFDADEVYQMAAVSKSKDIRNALVCMAVVVAAALLTWPVADLPFNDDFSYTFSVKRLLETGHLLYNGWSSPLMITQAYWGLMWVKAFGFSFDVLRLSMMPLAAGSILICYPLCRRCGLPASAAVFVSLLFGLSPLFIPLATSFMSDVPGCLTTLGATYAMVRCMQSWVRKNAVTWLAVGVLIATLGGLSRQSVWLVPLALLPWAAWLRRRDPLFIFICALAWLAVLITAMGMQHWFESQRFSLPEPSLRSELAVARKHPAAFLVRYVDLLLTLVMVLLPAAIIVLWQVRTRRMVAVTALIVLVLIGCLSIHPRLEVAPWMENMIEPVGILGNIQITGIRPLVMPYPILPALSIAIFVTIAGLITIESHWLIKSGTAGWRNLLLKPDSEQSAIVAILLVAGSYLLTMLTRCALDFSYDRHLLPLIPLLGIVLLWQMRIGSVARPIPATAWMLLAVFGIYAIASTQEDIALARARVTAARRLTDAKIPRTRISGGLEYDFWTQLLVAGYINDPRIQTPADAYQPHGGFTPSVQPVYRLEYQPAADSVPSTFGTVTYFSVLPPFQRKICIDRIVQK